MLSADGKENLAFENDDDVDKNEDIYAKVGRKKRQTKSSDTVIQIDE